MIAVICQSPSGRDEIDAPTPEAALLAARTLYDEAFAANPVQGQRRATTLTFLVGGEVVRHLEGVRP